MALPHDLVVPFEQATGGYLVEGYGLSECSPVLMANPVADNRKAGTVGLPSPAPSVAWSIRTIPPWTCPPVSAAS
jgi:acyl-CoA synthetase (AMP-forming)/AMP-acid ligase II